MRCAKHVQACEHCAAVLTGERALFAAVDAGLHKPRTQKYVLPFFLTCRQPRDRDSSDANPIPAWGLVFATSALALAVAFLGLPRGAHDKANTEAITVQGKVAAEAGEVELSHAPERKTRFSAKAVAANEQQDIAGATSHEPDVLIQPEEEEFLKRFYASMPSPAGEAKVVVTDNHEVTPKSLSSSRLK